MRERENKTKENTDSKTKRRSLFDCSDSSPRGFFGDNCAN